MSDPLDDARAAGPEVLRTPGLGHVYAASLPEGSHYSARAVTRNAERAIREADAPFVIRASYLQPHRPMVVPEPWASRHAEAQFDVSSERYVAGSLFETRFAAVNRGLEMPPEELLRARRMYYGSR